MRILRGSLILALSVLSLFSISSCNRDIKKTGTGVVVSCGHMDVSIAFYDAGTVRITKVPGNASPNTVASFAVVQKPVRVPYIVEKASSDTLIISTSEIKILLNRRSRALSFLSLDGNKILSEREEDHQEISQSFIIRDDEYLYGLGQHQQGSLNMRGQTVKLENFNMEIAIPFVQSDKGYGILWDNNSKSEFTENNGVMTFTSDAGNCIDYYFFYGGSPDGVIAGLRDLTGQVPMQALWSYGYHQSRERYKDAQEVLNVLGKYREDNVPIDGIIQDWQYWGKDNAGWNGITFDRSRYPDPAGFCEKIHRQNAHIIISVWPSFGPESDIYKELDSHGLLMKHDTYPYDFGVRNYDAFSPMGREIYWNHLRDSLLSVGIDGWWLDATEPEFIPSGEADYDQITAVGPFRNVRNAYPISTIKGVYDGQRSLTADRRVFILTRSASSGMQRYGAHVWSGDITASWETLRKQIPAALNFSMSGFPYWNCDIGGFFTRDMFPQGKDDPEYRRLYLRWMQFATFTGMMRSHGTNTPREIFQFGRPGDFFFEAIRDCIKMRYMLMPYIYSQAWEITSASRTLMRPLVMEWPKNPFVKGIDDEYMFGHSILVAPVTTDTPSRNVYLPQGGWVDFWTGIKLDGGKEQKYDAHLDKIPLFVKQGSIIPIGPDVQYAAEKSWDDIQIRIYPGADAHFLLYEDSGDGYGYEKGQYSTIAMDWNDSDSILKIGNKKGSFPESIGSRQFRLVLVRPGSGSGFDRESCDMVITYDGHELSVNFNEISKINK